MNSILNVWTIALFLVLVILDRFLKKKSPRFYKRLDLPANVFFSVCLAIYSGFLIYAVYDALTRDVSKGDKIFMVIFIAVMISINIAIGIVTWRQWLKNRKNS